MSIKRSKQRTFGKSGDSGDEDDYFAKPKEPDKSWEQHMEGKGDGDFTAYAMQSRYVKGQLVSHPKFGRGVVVGVEATNVQILFQDGTKKLGHGIGG
jgi:hypothetical protein